MSKLPAPLPSQRLSKADKRAALVQKVQEAKQELDQSWQGLKRDGILAAAGVASVYVGYRFVAWLFKPKRKNKSKKEEKEPQIRYVEVPSKKKSSGWANLILSKAGETIMDIVLEKVQDSFTATGKKDTNKSER